MTAARRTRILIVDDSAVMRSLLRSVVTTDAGLEVAGTAADGASALASLAQLQPDLILLDVEMPVMDGLVTLRELRRRGNRMPVMSGFDMLKELRAEGYDGVKVLMVTTEAENDFILRALDAGADEYLMKPFDHDALDEKLAMLGLAEA